MEGSVDTRKLRWVSHALAVSAEGLLVKNGLRGYEDREWAGATVDSRSSCSGRLFFAFGGENTDGHLYVGDAYSSGSPAVVVEDASVCGALESEGIPYLLVSSSLQSLQALARAYRDLLDVRVVAITGSTGKTTTKEYVRQVMKSKYRVSANPGNFNSLIGVPITVLETEPDNEYLVCEIGANQVGEVGYLAELLRPEIGVITNVGDAHIGMFGSVEAIADAKSELLQYVVPHGYAVLPMDDAFFGLFKQRSAMKTVTFGRSPGTDFVLSDVVRNGVRLDFKVNEEELSIDALGEYNALNACAAFAVGDICGVEHVRIRDALASVKPMPGRGRIHSVGGVTIIDESYNASPASMIASLTMLEGLDATRRLAVMGDMKELGDYAVERHRNLGERLARAKIDSVYWMGEEGASAKECFVETGGKTPFHLYDSTERLVADVEADLRGGDAVLVKASRLCNLNRVVAQLLEMLESRSES